MRNIYITLDEPHRKCIEMYMKDIFDVKYIICGINKYQYINIQYDVSDELEIMYTDDYLQKYPHHLYCCIN